MVKNVSMKDPSSVTFTDKNFPWRPGKKHSLEGVTIMVNPGHGCIKGHSIDNGAKGKLNGKTILEKDLTDKVSEKLARKLEALGANVIYVDNMPVTRTWELENIYHPDTFVAIHFDAPGPGNKKARGETVYANGDSQKSMKLQKEVNKFFKADNTIPNRPNDPEWMKHKKVMQADPSIPAILIEGGFMTNKADLSAAVTPEYQDKIAQMTVEGIKKYIAKTKKQRAKEKEQEQPYHIINRKFKTQFIPFSNKNLFSMVSNDI